MSKLSTNTSLVSSFIALVVLTAVTTITGQDSAADRAEAERPVTLSSNAGPASHAAGELAGLWQARRVFTPGVGGELTLTLQDGIWYAHSGTLQVRATATKSSISFEFPGNVGAFRGQLNDDYTEIVGHWIQPRTIRSFSRMATPLTLRLARASAPEVRFTGAVSAMEDVMHMFLHLAVTPDGRLAGHLRNPEANVGRFYPIADVRLNNSETNVVDVSAVNADGDAILNGQFDRDWGRLSMYLPYNGGTYDFYRVNAATPSSFFPRREIGAGDSAAVVGYAYQKPIAAEDDWATAHPEDVGLSRGPLEALVRHIISTPMDAIESPQIHAVLVARRGKLVLEEYFHGYARNRVHGTRSASKSVTTTLAGIAEQQGHLSRSTDVYDLLQPDAERQIAIEHMMTMSSGLDCDDWSEDSPGGEDRMQNQEEQPNWVRFTLDLDQVYEPGTHAAYCSGGQHVTGAAVSAASGMWLPDFYQRYFAEPLNMGIYHMNLSPVGRGYGGGGLYLLPRDFLKLGQLYLNDGVWNGRRILPDGWVATALRPAHNIGDEGYGYGWWSFDYPEPAGTAYYAGGNGGQYVIIIPALQLTIAVFGGNYNQRVMHNSKYELIPQYVLPAVQN